MPKLFPTDADYGAVMQKHPAPKLALIDRAIQTSFSAHHSIDFGNWTLHEWFIHLANRMIQARQAYHLMMYYFDLGIPDERPWISPGRDGQSVEYFPDFSGDDHSKHAWFNFYADCFATKLFSAFDSLGQLLNVLHGLNIDKPSFDKAIKALTKIGHPMAPQLLVLRDESGFKALAEYRHDTTHNFLPGVFGGSVIRKPGVTSFGVGRYTPSKKVVTVSLEAICNFDQGLRILGLR